MLLNEIWLSNNECPNSQQMAIGHQGTVTTMNCQFVFIHTKTHPPLHLILNYRRTSKIVGRGNTWLLHDKRFALEKLFANHVTMPWMKDEIELETSYGYPKDLRNNFWFSSLVRFSLLNRFMQSHNKATIHIESDVIIANDFPVQQFLSVNTPFAYPIVSNKRGIASTLFIRDQKSAEFLWKYSKDSVLENPLASDMEILFGLWKEHPEMVTRLPIAPRHLFRISPDHQESLPFSGYFDGHDFGVYVGGTNPWNKRGVSDIRHRMEGSLLNFTHDSIFYDRKRRFVSIRNSNRNGADSLYSLHITNKNALFFTGRLLPLILKFWLIFYVRTQKTYHPIVFVIMVFKSFRRRLPKCEVPKIYRKVSRFLQK